MLLVKYLRNRIYIYTMPPTKTFDTFLQRADYSLMDSLNADPEATDDGHDHRPREVLSGHYVPVTPTPLPDPEYIAHSKALFTELGLDQDLALDEKFGRLFTGDITVAQKPMRSVGWATGYALSIYGTEYIQQCPFGTGNGYGDGRAISVFEGLFEGKRWEMQLKGGGRTPYCRGADGRGCSDLALFGDLCFNIRNGTQALVFGELEILQSQHLGKQPDSDHNTSRTILYPRRSA